MKIVYPPTTREEHPLPAVILHWVHVSSMAVLIATGFYIHQPYYPGAMDLNRMLHFIFMFVVLYGAVIRIYWAFVGLSAPLGSRERAPDYKWFFEPLKVKRFRTTMSYYLFLHHTHPADIKYNPLQAITYLFFIFLIAVMGLTGFAIWTPTERFLLPLTYAFGGAAVMRFVHYIGMWIFIIMTVIHLYFALIEALREIPLMFLWRESPGREEEESL